MPAIGYVLLLRGINVNPSTRLAMSDLRDILGGLGYRQVTTLLQSGNVILESDGRPDVGAIQSAILNRTGITSPALALTIDEFAERVRANPFVDAGDDLSKMVITFLAESIDPSKVTRPSDEELAPERLAITDRAIYQWCPDGILQSRLKPAWWKQLEPLWTARNVRTANRILDAAST